MQELTFTCTCCGEEHSGLPDLAFDAPHYYAELSEEEKASKAKKSDDFCTINQEDFFIRAVLRVPIIGYDDDFGWGVWVSLSRENFHRSVELFNVDDPTSEGPFFGWFSNRLPWYPETLLLKTNVYLQRYPHRPLIQLEPTEHLLSVHQRNGIDVQTLQKIVEANLHPRGSAS